MKRVLLVQTADLSDTNASEQGQEPVVCKLVRTQRVLREITCRRTPPGRGYELTDLRLCVFSHESLMSESTQGHSPVKHGLLSATKGRSKGVAGEGPSRTPGYWEAVTSRSQGIVLD